MCGPKHVEQLRNIGIINSTTRLHLVGSSYEFYRFVSVVAVENFLFNFSNFSADCSIACLTNNGAMGPQYAAALNEL